jgi:hypothetical protein
MILYSNSKITSAYTITDSLSLEVGVLQLIQLLLGEVGAGGRGRAQELMAPGDRRWQSFSRVKQSYESCRMGELDSSFSIYMKCRSSWS